MSLRVDFRRCSSMVCSLVLAGSGIGLLGDCRVCAQVEPQTQELAKKQARTFEEVRRLVGELEEQAERQRAQLKLTEASLKRARALLAELESDPATRPKRVYIQRSRLSQDEERNLPDQSVVEKIEWKWDEARTTPEASMSQLGQGYHLIVGSIQGAPWSKTITLSREGQPDFTWRGHQNTVFVRREDVLYVADFNPITSGCSIVARDLKAGKPLWKTNLIGIKVSHSKYRNQINLEVDDKHLTVFGNESYGQYIELLDLKTGQTVGHRVFERPIK